MTTFVDVSTICQLVELEGISSFYSGLAKTIEEDFENWAAFDKCARVASHSEVGVIELMPSANDKKYAFKYVNGHPSNTKSSLPTVMAFGALADVKTGYPEIITELTVTTAFRTAATSAIAASKLARKDAKLMGMIGCGAQSEFQILAFHFLLGLSDFKIYDIDESAVSKLANNLKQFPQLRVEVVKSATDVTTEVDIITTCTADKRWATILTEEMVSDGVHINAIGGDCPGKTELCRDLLEKSDIFVEYEPQTRIEGDIQQLAKTHPVTELWRVIKGVSPARINEQQITVFDSVGFAIEDYSAIRFIQKLSQKYQLGELIDLIPRSADPKNLFGVIQSSQKLASISSEQKQVQLV